MRSLLILARHEVIYSVSREVAAILDLPEGYVAQWVYDKRFQTRWFVITHDYRRRPTWRMRITAPMWHNLSTPDTEVQFEEICKLRDWGGQIKMRLESAQRGGYD